MDFSELSHQSEIRDSLDKILSEHCSQECLKEYDSNFHVVVAVFHPLLDQISTKKGST